MLTCPRSSLSFHSNAHHHGSLPQQLGVVWDLLLKADPEGPSLISHAAVRHRFHFALIRYMCLCSTLWPKIGAGPPTGNFGNGLRTGPVPSTCPRRRLCEK